jgi:hypothetical protein
MFIRYNIPTVDTIVFSSDRRIKIHDCMLPTYSYTGDGTATSQLKVSLNEATQVIESFATEFFCSAVALNPAKDEQKQHNTKFSPQKIAALGGL